MYSYILGRDLPRTFTTENILEKEGLEQLKNNLEALAFWIPEVGYWQGMNFISATLLSILKDEELCKNKIVYRSLRL